MTLLGNLVCFDVKMAYRDETVARPLGEEADSEDNEETKTIPFGLEERYVRSALLGSIL